MRSFETRGPVYPEDNYVVARTDELSDFINRLEKGRYVVLFAPRQTGKTTFFRRALETLPADVYFPIRLDFQASNNLEPAVFYQGFYEDICEEIEAVFQKRGSAFSPTLTEFLDNTEITDHLSMRRFFRRFSNFLEHHHNNGQKVVLIIDEFDGIPRTVLSDFLYSLRHIYLSGRDRCPNSIGIVGVKSITQLNYDRSISPFNIQDEFKLPNFTLEQVRELLSQYTDEVG
ncbi:AAA family ATPase, partial [Candidatus Poribacteria bacterium]|nr:AAA family ATPase [Candidatus Poribacteria bacterium]